MAVTREDLAGRIRSAREACRMTQEEVAARLGMPRSAVVQIEAANSSVSSLELDRFAHLFGKDIRDFLADTFQPEDSLAALFRAPTSVVADDDVQHSLRECLALARELASLERHRFRMAFASFRDVIGPR